MTKFQTTSKDDSFNFALFFLVLKLSHTTLARERFEMRRYRRKVKVKEVLSEKRLVFLVNVYLEKLFLKSQFYFFLFFLSDFRSYGQKMLRRTQVSPDLTRNKLRTRFLATWKSLRHK